MRNRHNSRATLEVRVDYVESKLDETIKDFKEAIIKSDRSFKEAMQQMEARHRDAMADLKAVVEKSETRAEAMLKDSRTSRNWTVGTCIAVITLIVTIASGIVGQILTAIASY